MRFQILLASWQKQRPDPEKNDVGHFTFCGQFEFESWVWFGTEFELFHRFLLKVESQWRWLSFETWTKIFVLSYNSQPANQKRFASVCVITKQTATSGRGFIVSLAHSGYRDMLPRPQKNKLCFSESDFRADSKATL